ncbi:MAG: endonuclease/exonuclease/phosphatase family protein [Candidatus Paceibacterota bacterium]|jgi:exonuclease III
MKLISLNAWNGLILEPFLEFIETNKDIDIFCLQEIFHSNRDEKMWQGGKANIFTRIANILTTHDGYFSAIEEALDDKPARGVAVPWGMAVFVKKGIPVGEAGEEFVYRHKNAYCNDDTKTLGRSVQYMKVGDGKDAFTLFNFHGLWNGEGKTDSEPRLIQSQKIKALLDKIDGRKVFAGDFNLLPQTESYKIIKEGMIDLIEKYNITNTRSTIHYQKPDRFADYVLVTPDVIVKSFNVMDVHVSDHLPLIMEFK